MVPLPVGAHVASVMVVDARVGNILAPVFRVASKMFEAFRADGGLPSVWISNGWCGPSVVAPKRFRCADVPHHYDESETAWPTTWLAQLGPVGRQAHRQAHH